MAGSCTAVGSLVITGRERESGRRVNGKEQLKFQAAEIMLRSIHCSDCLVFIRPRQSVLVAALSAI